MTFPTGCCGRFCLSDVCQVDINMKSMYISANLIALLVAAMWHTYGETPCLLLFAVLYRSSVYYI